MTGIGWVRTSYDWGDTECSVYIGLGVAGDLVSAKVGRGSKVAVGMGEGSSNGNGAGG